MPSNYVIIGGAAYQPGSAAAKRAAELYAAMPKPQTATSAAGSIIAPYAATPGAAPTTFPSYPSTAGTMSSAGGFMSPSLAGAPGLSGKGAFGLVPQVPNPISTAGGAIAGNQVNLPALSRLGTDTTKLTAGLARLPFELNLPNYAGNLGLAASNVGSNLAGIISRPTSEAITRAAAERGARIGAAPGSPNTLTNWLGVLGNTSEQLQALGAGQLNQMIASTPTGQPFNVAGSQVSPADVQSAQWGANVEGAAPDPTQAAQANLDMLLRSIEAGRVAGNPGFAGGGGGGGIPRMPSPTAPGSALVHYPYYGGGAGGSVGGRYVPTIPTAPTAPGVSPWPTADTQGAYQMTPEEEFYYGTNPTNPLAPGGSLGESVFDPYSLGGYSSGSTSDFGGIYDPNVLGGYAF